VIGSLEQLWFGFRSPIMGMSLIIRNPKIGLYAVIPFLLSSFLMVAMLYWTISDLPNIVSWALGYIGLTEITAWWAQIIYYTVLVLGGISFLLAGMFAGYIAVLILGAPFNSMLAEKTLSHLKRLPAREAGLKEWVRLSVKMLLVSLVKAVIFLVFAVILFVLSLIPVVNLVASFCACLVMAFDSTDYSFEVLGFGLRKRFFYFKKNIFVFAGFALALAVTLLIPGLNFFLIPAAVVAGAHIVGKIEGTT